MHGEPAPFELLKWTIIEKTGWTVEYFNSLPLSELWEYVNVLDGQEKGRMKK